MTGLLYRYIGTLLSLRLGVPYEAQGRGTSKQTARVAVYEEILNIVLCQPEDTAEHLSVAEIQRRVQRLRQKSIAQKKRKAVTTLQSKEMQQVKWCLVFRVQLEVLQFCVGELIWEFIHYF